MRLGTDWVWGWDQHRGLGHTGCLAVAKVQFDGEDSWAWGQVRTGDAVAAEGQGPQGGGQNQGPTPSHPLRSAHPQGRQASQDEVTASAYQAVLLDQKYNNEPVQVRVPMGKEPPHLMSIFKGRMVVYQVRLLDRGAWRNPN